MMTLGKKIIKRLILLDPKELVKLSSTQIRYSGEEENSSTKFKGRVCHLVSRLLGIETFPFILRVSVSVSKILASKESFSLGLKIFCLKKVSVSLSLSLGHLEKKENYRVRLSQMIFS